MENLKHEGNRELPSVFCNAKKGLIEISGISISENPREEIYQSLLYWLDRYSKTPKSLTEVNINLHYFNTVSSVCLIDMFRRIKSIHNSSDNNSVVINWFYEEDDEDMVDVIDAFEENLGIPFVKQMIKEN